MQSLAAMADKLPQLYESYKKFLSARLFSDEEEEMADPNKQGEFTKKFYVDLEEETQQKADAVEEKEAPASGSEEEKEAPASGSGDD
jgi:hypothetical protein